MSNTDDSKSISKFPGEYPPMTGFLFEKYGIRDEFEDDESLATTESECGGIPDSQHVEQYDGTLGVTEAFVDDHQAPVGNIVWNNNLGTIYTVPGNVNSARWASGSLIANDLFLTAGHNFDARDVNGWILPRINGTSNIILPADIAQNMHVDFNFQLDALGNPQATQSFAITQLVEYRLGDLDYAIVRLAGNPGATFNVQPVSTLDADYDDMICVIGHPRAGNKQIEAGPATGFTATTVQYNDIDTYPGNSGSGMLHAARNAIIGVHTNGGCTATGGYNVGVKISAIIKASPTVRNLATRVITHGIEEGRNWGSDRAGTGIASGSLGGRQVVGVTRNSGGNARVILYTWSNRKLVTLAEEGGRWGADRAGTSIAFGKLGGREVVGVTRNRRGNARVILFTWNNGRLETLAEEGNRWGTDRAGTGISFGTLGGRDVVGVTRNSGGNARVILYTWRNGRLETLAEEGTGWGSDREGTGIAFGNLRGHEVVGVTRNKGGNARVILYTWQNGRLETFAEAGRNWGSDRAGTSIAFGILSNSQVVGVTRNSGGNARVILYYSSVEGLVPFAEPGQHWGGDRAGTGIAFGTLGGRKVVGVTRNSGSSARVILYTWVNGRLETLAHEGGGWGNDRAGTGIAFGETDAVAGSKWQVAGDERRSMLFMLFDVEFFWGKQHLMAAYGKMGWVRYQ
jgi:V8-like Glu-specific endopeptidase